MPIRQFLPGGASFDLQATRAMGEAFESAWRIVEFSRTPVTKEALAAKIVAAASAGERDPIRLLDAALRELGLHR